MAHIDDKNLTGQDVAIYRDASEQPIITIGYVADPTHNYAARQAVPTLTALDVMWYDYNSDTTRTVDTSKTIILWKRISNTAFINS